MSTKPLVTIGLPLYNMGDIQWLAFESIKRLETDIPFEVIVYVEKDKMGFIPPKIHHPYCVNFTVGVFNSWMPLPMKWKLMAKEARGDVFMLQAGDCYSDSKRVDRAYRDIIEQGFDWTQDCDGWFYHIQKKKLLRFNQSERKSGLNMAFRTSLGKNLPDSDRRRGIDFWLYSNMNIKRTKWNKGENMSVDTHGYNTISVKRGKYFETVIPPFFHTSKRITNLLPTDIIKGLEVEG